MKSLYLDRPWNIYGNYVLLLLARIMEQGNHVTFIETLLPFAGIIFIIAVGVVLLTQQFRKNLYREQAEQEALKNKHQSELMRSGMLVQEAERKRIAQDMHDELGATLSISRMHLLQLERKFGIQDEQLLGELQNIRSLTENSLESMRRISHRLMPPQLEQFGFLKTMESVCHQLNETGNIQVEFVAEDEISKLITDELVQLTLYRICMELINNTIKHAQGKALSLRFKADENNLLLQYSDNGIGMDFDSERAGSGMNNLMERIRFLGGTCRIDTSPKKGFSIEVNVPVKTE